MSSLAGSAALKVHSRRRFLGAGVRDQPAAFAKTRSEAGFQRRQEPSRRRRDAVCVGETPGNRSGVYRALAMQPLAGSRQQQIVDVVGKSRRRSPQPGDLPAARNAMRENHIIVLGDVAADRHVAIDDRVAADVTLRAEQIEKRANPHLRGISGSLQEQHAKRRRQPRTGLIDFGTEHCRIWCAWPASVRD
jgi:hypothetical protein